jgi:hypothetical protein
VNLDLLSVGWEFFLFDRCLCESCCIVGECLILD